MSADFIARLIGMIVFSILGVYLGTYLGRMANLNPGDFPFSVEQYAFTIGLVGALTGLILTPLLLLVRSARFGPCWPEFLPKRCSLPCLG